MTKQRKPVENGEIKVEHGVPMPAGRSPYIYPLEEMKAADSFFVPVDPSSNKFSRMQTVRQFARSKNIAITVRSMPGGFRVWRVK